MTQRSTLVCAGCGAGPPPGDPYGWACPNRRRRDDTDHVMTRRLDLAGLPFVTSDSENPFVRYRSLLRAYHRWREAGRDDGSFVALVDDLDARVADVDGRGFRRTPLVRCDALDAAVGAQVWVKDETANVSGSHKGRHLFGIMILIRVAERLGAVNTDQAAAPLAIASCGNAALAAAVIAAAVGRRLEVFIPVDADPSVLERLASLGATLTVCPRPPGPPGVRGAAGGDRGAGGGRGAGVRGAPGGAGGAPGDPCYQRFVAAVEAGAIPFGCQGPDNGLAIEGGATLAWETAEALAAAGVAPERIMVQVGGGALASACFQGFREAVALGVLPGLPVLDTMQTSGGYPLARAWLAVAARIRDEGLGPAEALRHAAEHRSRYMWPWETIPASVAHGIVDDETYDWLAVVRGMVETGGSVTVADEAALAEANRLARTATGIDVDHTGSAGLAGLLVRSRSGITRRDQSAAGAVVIFSGAKR